MFRCDLLIEDDVLVVATGEGEKLEREWLVESVIEACGSAAAFRAMVVVDVRHAWFDQGLEKAVEEITLFCANHGGSDSRHPALKVRWSVHLALPRRRGVDAGVPCDDG